MTNSIRIGPRARRSAGFTLIETLVALAIIMGIFLVAFRVWSVNKYLQKFVYPRVNIVQSASRNLAAELEALAAADPVSLYGQLVTGKTFAVAGGGRGQLNRDVTFTVVSVVTPAPASPGDSPPLPLSYNAHLAFRTSFCDVGSVVVPIHRLGATTNGCDPANGVTTACAEYVVSRR